MSFAQGAPTQNLSIVASNTFVTGSSTAGNAFTVQQLSTGNVASFLSSTGFPAMVVSGGGNVGIGTSLPVSNLTVVGTMNVISTANIANIFTTNIVGFVGSQWTSGTNNVYYLANVGIGTSIVSANLTVTGNIFASNAVETNNISANYYTRELGAYLIPSSSNANTITQWMMGVAKTPTLGGSPWNNPANSTITVFDTSNISGWQTSIFLQDGRIMYNPSFASNYGPAFFNPMTNQFTYFTGGQFSTVQQWQHGAMVQIPTGNVIMFPTINRLNGDYIGILNPIDLSWSTIAATVASFGGYGTAFSTCVLGPDSNVYGVPLNTSNIGIYNPITNTFSVRAIADALTYPLYGAGNLLPDGRIVFTPTTGGTSNIGIFTPSTWSFSNVTVNTGGGWYNSIVLPNSNVLLLGDQKIGNYNPILNTFSTTLTVSGRTMNGGAVLVPDGRVFIATYQNILVVYNWVTNAVADVPNSSGLCAGVGKMVPDGRIIFLPISTGIPIINTTYSVPIDFCKHPIINKY